MVVLVQMTCYLGETQIHGDDGYYGFGVPGPLANGMIHGRKWCGKSSVVQRGRKNIRTDMIRQMLRKKLWNALD